MRIQIMGSFALALAVWASTLSAQTKDPNRNATERAAKVHSQLWHSWTTDTIAQGLVNTRGILIRHDDEDGRENDYAHQILPPYPPMRMVEFACMSDAVVVGRAEAGASSHMTADLRFIYSEWKFRIKRVLKDNRDAHIHGSEMQIVRAGGTLKIDGRIVIGVEQHFPQFQPGDEYLLYLKYIPETGFYRAIAERSFDLSHGPVVDAPYMDRDWTTKVPTDELLRDTRAAISAAGPGAYCAKSANRN